MSNFVWGDDYRLGCAAMDAEHVILFALLDQLASIGSPPDNPAAVSDIVRALVAYIGVHFAHEEALMQRCGFPSLEAHIAMHRQIAEELDALAGTFAEARDVAVAANIRSFVFNWLVQHILTEDKKYVPHTKAA